MVINYCVGCGVTGTMLHVAGGPPAPLQVIPGGLPPPGHPLPVSAPHINPAFVPAASSSTLPPPGGAVRIDAAKKTYQLLTQLFSQVKREIKLLLHFICPLWYVYVYALHNV